MPKAKSKPTRRPSAAHPPKGKSTAADPVFAAIDAHRAAWRHQEKIGAEHTRAENRAARSKGGKDTPEFRAIDRQWNSAVDAAGERMRKLIATRPATIEGAAAQAAYVRAVERWEGSPLDRHRHGYDPQASALEAFGQNLRRLVGRPYSDAYRDALQACAELEAKRKERFALWRKDRTQDMQRSRKAVRS